jgi:hypothetical protein
VHRVRTCPSRPTAGVGEWVAADDVELAHVPFDGCWLNRIEAQFTALRELVRRSGTVEVARPGD